MKPFTKYINIRVDKETQSKNPLALNRRDLLTTLNIHQYGYFWDEVVHTDNHYLLNKNLDNALVLYLANEEESRIFGVVINILRWLTYRIIKDDHHGIKMLYVKLKYCSIVTYILNHCPSNTDLELKQTLEFEVQKLERGFRNDVNFFSKLDLLAKDPEKFELRFFEKYLRA